MKRIEFLNQLKARLWTLPEADIQCSLDYYSEMIDDRMEDGLSEEEAVAAIGDLDEIVKQILSETPRPPAVVKPEEKQQKQQKRTHDNTKTWLIILLVLGSLVWIPLLASAIGTVIGIYVSLWSVVIALYAAFLALAVSSVGCIVGSFFMFGGITGGIVAWGAALVCAGLAILLLLLANLAAKGMVKLTKLVWNSIFRRKERSV
jgi:uncharacterized membrane protein